MKKTFRLFRRGNVFWCQNNVSGKQESLRTTERETAQRLLHAKNEAQRQPIINTQIARAYLTVGDPAVATRTWQFVMEEIVKLKKDETQRRWKIAIKDEARDVIRNVVVLETRADRSISTWYRPWWKFRL